MNQLTPWNGRCQRCLKEAKTYTMSINDVSLICEECNHFENQKYYTSKEPIRVKKQCQTQKMDQNP